MDGWDTDMEGGEGGAVIPLAPPLPPAAGDALTNLTHSLNRLATYLATLPQDEVPDVYASMKAATKVLEAHESTLRDRLLLQATVDGKQTTEAGTREFVVGRNRIQVIPMKTGTDPKKLEAALRAKRLNPAEWMEPVTSYKVDPAKLWKLEDMGVISETDLKAVAYEPSYRVVVKPVVE